jgi:hypothetical protein
VVKFGTALSVLVGDFGAGTAGAGAPCAIAPMADARIVLRTDATSGCLIALSRGSKMYRIAL